jgi:hypothetical protein
LTAEQARSVRNGRQPAADWFAGLSADCDMVQMRTDDDLVAIAVPGADGVWKLDTVMPAVPAMSAKEDPSCA